ncbi:hypothetical protein EMIT0347P_20512 [Pseudomonas sp. IT-347P]
MGCTSAVGFAELNRWLYHGCVHMTGHLQRCVSSNHRDTQ